MANALADFLTRQRAAFKAEAMVLTAAADKDSDGRLTAEQDVRFKAIEADIALIDTQIAASQATVETPEQAVDRVRAEIADVTAACTIAGMPGKAADFIKAKTPLPEVLKALQDEKVKASPAEISGRNSGRQPAPGGASPEEISAGWDAAAAKVNKQFGLKKAG